MDPDTLAAACHILADEWGSYGYRVDSIEPTGYGAGALSVRHFDGSRFVLAVDRRACHHTSAEHDGTTSDEARALIAAVNAAYAAHDRGASRPSPAVSATV